MIADRGAEAAYCFEQEVGDSEVVDLDLVGWVTNEEAQDDRHRTHLKERDLRAPRRGARLNFFLYL